MSALRLLINTFAYLRALLDRENKLKSLSRIRKRHLIKLIESIQIIFVKQMQTKQSEFLIEGISCLNLEKYEKKLSSNNSSNSCANPEWINYKRLIK